MDPLLEREAELKSPMQGETRKPLRHARSQAELTALKQRRIQICLSATNMLVTALIALKSFGII